LARLLGVESNLTYAESTAFPPAVQARRTGSVPSFAIVLVVVLVLVVDLLQALRRRVEDDDEDENEDDGTTVLAS